MARLPQNPAKVPPKVVGKLKLKESITSGTKEKLAGICVSEMQQLFLCFKNYSFNEEACTKEIASFKSCYNKHYINYKNKSQIKKDTGETSVSGINRLLKKYSDKYYPK